MCCVVNDVLAGEPALLRERHHPAELSSNTPDSNAVGRFESI